MTKLFVFDTNSLISTFLTPYSVNSKALEKAIAIGTVIYSHNTLDEFVQTLVRPKFDRYATVEQRLKAVEAFIVKAHLIDVTTAINDCRDPKDNKFLELAVEAAATCIITGDKDLLVLNPFRNIPVLTASEFLNQY